MTTAKKTAEEHFAEEMRDAAEEFGKILRPYFRGMPDENLETLLLISMAVFLGADNVYQVLQVLGLPKTATYDRVRNISVYHWRKFLQSHLYSLAIPLLAERLSKSDATRSRDGLILAVDDTVIARIATELGYVWRWWSGQLKRVAKGQNVIALILVVGDIILPLDIRIVSKQGRGLRTKPEIYEEMLAAARARFATAGIDIAELRTTGDAAYFSEKIAAFCRGKFPAEAPSDPDTATSQSDPDPAGGAPETPGHESGDTDPALLPTITGIFRGRDNHVFEIDGKRQKAGQWRKDLKDSLAPGWGTDGQPVCRTGAFSEKFGDVILLSYIPKGRRAISHLITVGRPLRAGETLHAYSFHHRTEDFRKLLRDTLELGAMHLRGREGAHACVGIKIIAYLVVSMMRQNLKRLGRFRNVTISGLVGLCPKFVDVRQIFKELFPGIVPGSHTLDDALA